MQLRQIAQHASDLPRAIAFYSKLLNQEPVAVFEGAGLAFFTLGETRLLLDTNGVGSPLIYLEVPDVRESVETFRAQGIEIHTEPHVVFPDSEGLFDRPGNEWLAFLKDSEGNLVGLMSREATD